jgi:hypothetical protein
VTPEDLVDTTDALSQVLRSLGLSSGLTRILCGQFALDSAATALEDLLPSVIVIEDSFFTRVF